MLLIKGCKRCQGDLFLERGLCDADFVCLQCGRCWNARPAALTTAMQLPKTA